MSNSKVELLSSDLQALHSLSSRGFAVVVWSPKELRGADCNAVEEQAIVAGNDAIDLLADED